MSFKTPLVLFVAVLITLFGCEPKKQSAQESPSANATAATVESGETGSDATDSIEADVVIVKYSDYQCPACKYYAAFIQQAKDDFGDRIHVVYKHYPLSIHPYAELAARVSEAARAQGKYREMHNMLFNGQEQWSQGNAEAIFLGYARSLGLDMDQFRNDMNSAAMQRIVIADKREGRQLGINSTPTIYINDVKLENNPRYYEDFKAMIEEALSNS